MAGRGHYGGDRRSGWYHSHWSGGYYNQSRHYNAYHGYAHTYHGHSDYQSYTGTPLVCYPPASHQYHWQPPAASNGTPPTDTAAPPPPPSSSSSSSSSPGDKRPRETTPNPSDSSDSSAPKRRDQREQRPPSDSSSKEQSSRESVQSSHGSSHQSSSSSSHSQHQSSSSHSHYQQESSHRHEHSSTSDSSHNSYSHHSSARTRRWDVQHSRRHSQQTSSQPPPAEKPRPQTTDADKNKRQKAPIRPFVKVSDCIRTDSVTTVSLLSYNVLAQDLISKNGSLYTHSPPEFLAWEYRKTQLLNELVASAPDIFCLQEVEEEHYHSWFKPKLRHHDYEGLYQRRTGTHLDGCAIFYCTDKFRLVEWKGVQYQQAVKVLDRDNVGIVAKLVIKNQPKSSRAPVFCVANTHLLFNPKAGEVKLAQLSLLFAELHKMASIPGSEHLLPCLLCGDFNSTPNCPLLQLVENAKLDCTAISAWEVAGYHTNRTHSRRIPVPLFPASLNISQECRYVCTCSSKQQETKKQLSSSESDHPPPTPPIVTEPSPLLNSDNLTLVSSNHLSLSKSEEVIDLTRELPTAMKKFSHCDITTTKKVKVMPPSLDKKRFGGVSLSDFPSLVLSSEKSTSVVKTVSTCTLTQTAEGNTAQDTATTTGEDCMIVAVNKHCTCECFACKVWPCLKVEHSPPTQPEEPSMLTHPFHFSPAYPHLGKKSSTVTTYHGSAHETVDYIYYTSYRGDKKAPGFSLLSRVALPSAHTLVQLGPQPHKHLSSDHLLLKATFQLL